MTPITLPTLALSWKARDEEGHVSAEGRVGEYRLLADVQGDARAKGIDVAVSACPDVIGVVFEAAAFVPGEDLARGQDLAVKLLGDLLARAQEVRDGS
jgi:hypothetical protein